MLTLEGVRRLSVDFMVGRLEWRRDLCENNHATHESARVESRAYKFVNSIILHWCTSKVQTAITDVHLQVTSRLAIFN